MFIIIKKQKGNVAFFSLENASAGLPNHRLKQYGSAVWTYAYRKASHPNLCGVNKSVLVLMGTRSLAFHTSTKLNIFRSVYQMHGIPRAASAARMGP